MNNFLVRICKDASCIAVTEITDIPENEVLHTSELEYISSACAARRREFTAGRFAAKSAAKALCPELPEMTDFPVSYGEYGEPVIKDGPGLSISHDGKTAAAVCWKRDGLPSGIDLHHISGASYEVRNGFLDDNDENVLNREQSADAKLLYSYAWCAKESLSKLIRRGLSAMSDIRLISFCFAEGICQAAMTYGNERFTAYILRNGDLLMSLCVP